MSPFLWFFSLNFAEWVAVSLEVGIVSLLVAITFISIAWRCYSFLKAMSELKGDTKTPSGANTQDLLKMAQHRMRALRISPYQSVMYLGSVYYPEFHSLQFNLFHLLFKWTELLTLLASDLYVYRSVGVIVQ